jgi:type VI secretion system secreted protein Hcp
MANKMFIQFDGVTGVSPDSEHTGWIEISSFSYGASQPGNFGKDGQLSTGTADFSDFSITKEMDPTSPVLFEYLSAGTKVANATIHLTSSVGADKVHIFAKYYFEPVLLSGVSWGGAEGGGMPSESVSFRYNIVRTEFTPYNNQEAGTTIRAGWNVGATTKDATSIST